MDFTTLLSGVVLGFAIAAPVGPIGVLCIRRTLADGWLVGFISGLGAATADAIYGALAASGLALSASVAASTTTWVRLAGALFLCWLGMLTFRAPVRTSTGTTGARAIGMVRAYSSTVVLTLSNPLTIISLAGVFAGLGVGTGAQAASLVLGVFAGSALWWLGLSTAAGWLRRRVSLSVLVWVNRISGVIIFVFGLVTVLAIVVRGG